MNDYEKVNNYAAYFYADGECVIFTEPRQLQINDGKIYLTRVELCNLIALIDRNTKGERDE